jgi:hypothetical protein
MRGEAAGLLEPCGNTNKGTFPHVVYSLPRSAGKGVDDLKLFFPPTDSMDTPFVCREATGAGMAAAAAMWVFSKARRVVFSLPFFCCPSPKRFCCNFVPPGDDDGSLAKWGLWVVRSLEERQRCIAYAVADPPPRMILFYCY